MIGHFYGVNCASLISCVCIFVFLFNCFFLRIISGTFIIVIIPDSDVVKLTIALL